MTVYATSARTEFPFGNLRVRLRQALVRYMLRFAVLLPFLCCGPLFSVCRCTTERHHATQYGINASLPSSGLSVVHATPQDFAWEDWPGPSTQAYLLRTIFRRRYSPRFRSNRSTTIDKVSLLRSTSVEATPTSFAQEVESIDAGEPAPDHMFRPCYSSWFCSGRLGHDHRHRVVSSSLPVVDATPPANLLRTIFRRRCSPRFFSSKSTTSNKGLPAPVYFRRHYSREFRSQSKIHRRRRTCSSHLPPTITLIFSYFYLLDVVTVCHGHLLRCPCFSPPFVAVVAAASSSSLVFAIVFITHFFAVVVLIVCCCCWAGVVIVAIAVLLLLFLLLVLLLLLLLFLLFLLFLLLLLLFLLFFLFFLCLLLLLLSLLFSLLLLLLFSLLLFSLLLFSLLFSLLQLLVLLLPPSLYFRARTDALLPTRLPNDYTSGYACTTSTANAHEITDQHSFFTSPHIPGSAARA